VHQVCPIYGGEEIVVGVLHISCRKAHAFSTIRRVTNIDRCILIRLLCLQRQSKHSVVGNKCDRIKSLTRYICLIVYFCSFLYINYQKW